MFVVLGAGISGLTAAMLLAEAGHTVTLIEQASFVGGLAATRECFNIPVDVGSHRIHPAYHPEALKLIKELINEDMIRQKRNGRIMVLNKYIDYPPSIISLLKGFGVIQCIKWGKDLIKSLFLEKNADKSNFETYTQSKVGRGLYQDFYKPYAVKLWNIDPKQIDMDPAKQRVRRMGFLASIFKVISSITDKDAGYYFYPKHGIGQISEEVKTRFLKAGGTLLLNNKVKEFLISDNKIQKIVIEDSPGNLSEIVADNILSTLPIRAMKGLIKYSSTNTDFKLEYRALRIVYLKVNEDARSHHETFYIPTTDYKIGRISDIRKYSQSKSNIRVLTAEIPCSIGDSIWQADKNELLELCRTELYKLDIISDKKVIEDLDTILVPDVYPLYKIGWSKLFQEELSNINKVENLFHFGRTALFLHCNIDHCIHMSQTLVSNILNKESRDKWQNLQKSFAQFYIRE